MRIAARLVLAAVAALSVAAAAPAASGELWPGTPRSAKAVEQAKELKRPRDGGCRERGGDSRRKACLFVAPDGTNGNVWTHLAGTYDGSMLRLFVDGAEVSSVAAAGAMPASAGALRIGGNEVWGEWFEGLIDEVRVYDRALTAAELREDSTAGVAAAAPRPGLVAAYSFDAPGAVAADGSGRGNAGTVSGAAWTRSGRFGGALSFDGVDDSVSVADADSLDATVAVTLEAWVRPATLGDWRTVVLKEQAGNLVYALYANTGSPGRVDVPSMHAYLGEDIWTRGTAQLPLNSCRDDDEPCRTFAHAYRAAQPGQVVEVADGSYPAQALAADPAKTSDDDVVFVAERKARPRIAGLDVRASHVTFDSLILDGDWTTHDQTDDVTFRDLNVHGAIFIESSSNIRVLGGSVGGIKDYKPQFASSAPGTSIENILVEGVRFHDIRRTSNDVHIECLLIAGGRGVVLRGNRFEGCDVFDVSIGEFGGSGPPRGFLIENNFFGAADGFYSLHFNTNTSALHDVVVRNNSSTQRFYHGNDIPVLDGVRFVANVAPLAGGDCDPRITYRRNVWNGGTCGPTDLDAPSGFVDSGSGDLHLRKDAAAIGRGDPTSYPSHDIDGDARPRGRAPDAGADER